MMEGVYEYVNSWVAAYLADNPRVIKERDNEEIDTTRRISHLLVFRLR